MFNAIENFLIPIREKRAEVDSKGDEYILDVLNEGEKVAYKQAGEVEKRVVDVMGF